MQKITCRKRKTNGLNKTLSAKKDDSLCRISLFSYHVVGVAFTYVPKEGECQAICCDGAGGPLTVQRVCTPEDKCKGIESAEKEEDGHCPGEEKGTCPDTCETEEEGELSVLCASL